jgi:hypothetical protein
MPTPGLQRIIAYLNVDALEEGLDVLLGSTATFAKVYEA